MAASRSLSRSGIIRLGLALTILCTVGAPSFASALRVPRALDVVSRNYAGDPGGDCYTPAVSDDGRYVAFESWSSQSPSDTDLLADVYLRDRFSGTTTLITPNGGTYMSGQGCRDPRITDDGRYVSFITRAPLDPADVNGVLDVYIVDMQNPGVFTFVDMHCNSFDDYDMSGDGSTVVFESQMSGVVPEDTGVSGSDVFAIDVATAQITWVSEPGAADTAAWAGSRLPAVSDDGRYVAFLSGKDHVIEDANDAFQAPDWYIRDLDTGAFQFLPVRDFLAMPGYLVNQMEISGSGNAIAFEAGQSNSPAGIHVYYYNGIDFLQADNVPGFAGYSSRDPQLSDDGRYVGFYTRNPLDGQDMNGTVDYYYLDVSSGDPIMLDTGSWLGDGMTYDFVMSGDASTVCFAAYNDLVPGDVNSNYDVHAISVPVPQNDAFTAVEDVTLNGNVLANDPTGDIAATLVGDVSHGTLSLNGDGTFTYTPAPNFSGSDSFTYEVSDGVASWGTATAQIVVDPVNDAPVAVDDTFSTIMDQSLTVAAPGILANDSDVESGPLTASKVSDPTHGAVSLNADGSFTYTPASGYVGADSFTYSANDGSADSNVATVNITVDSARVEGVYRFYNVRTGAHLYTASASERDYVLQYLRADFVYEGVAYYADRSATAMPLYRFYNKWSGTHFFTASADEKARVETLYSFIYTYEGSAYGVSLAPRPGYVPVFRFYNLKNRGHFYTASVAEADTVKLTLSGTFKYEGIAFYVIQ